MGEAELIVEDGSRLRAVGLVDRRAIHRLRRERGCDPLGHRGPALEGDRSHHPVRETEFVELAPRFSPDGQWIAYSSNESGRREVYVRPFPGPGGKWQISTQGGVHPYWRRDGKEIFFLTARRRHDGRRHHRRDRNPERHPKVAVPDRRSPKREANGPCYSVSRTDRRFLVERPIAGGTVSPTTVVLNWAAGFGAKRDAYAKGIAHALPLPALSGRARAS